MTKVEASIDDRTSRFLSLYVPGTVEGRRFPFSSVAVRLGIDPAWARTNTGQTLLLTAANLLGRFVGRLVLDVPAIPVLSPLGSGKSDLMAETESFAYMARGKPQSSEPTEPTRARLPLVYVGVGQEQSNRAIKATAHGWRAELGSSCTRLPEGVEDSNPFGALVAATLAAAEVFKGILRSAGSSQRSVLNALDTFSISALDFDTNSEPNAVPLPSIDHLTATLVGAGAVANSLAFAWAAADLRGSGVRVIDPDRLDESNLNRHMLSSWQDVGRPKAELLAGYLRTHKISATPSVGRYQDIRTTLTQDELETTVSTVDNDEARIALQSDLPKLLFHGATDGDMAVVARHNFLDGACLGCLFYAQPKSYAESVADDTGLPLDEVVHLLESHGNLSGSHVDVIVRKNGSQFERLRTAIGRSFEEVYATQICGVLSVNIDGQRLSPTVSFVSALPGFLLAAELLKAGSPALERYRLKNYLAISLFAPSYRQLLFRQKDDRCRCFCSDPIMSSTYRRRWSQSGN
jgi:hypothetical protein